MIIKEFFEQRSDGINLYKTYSDMEFFIQKVGTSEFYAEAIDIEANSFEYVETARSIKLKKAEENIIEEPEIENGDQELTDEEAMELLKEVF
jgi:hypothetical protein